jgi:hypothetical protein
MGLLEFFSNLPLVRPLSFQRHPDSFAASRVTLYEKLLEVIKSLIGHPESPGSRLQKEPLSPVGSTVFLAAHFPDEFFRLQGELQRDGIEYEFITRPLDAQWFHDNAARSTNVVYLALAEFLTETTFNEGVGFGSMLNLIVVDRHPEPFRDAALEKFARDFPATTRLGYFLALDDRVLRSVINETTLTVLKQMGIDDQGLVSSGIISKRINKVLAREQKRRTGEGVAAESAQEWFELNE